MKKFFVVLLVLFISVGALATSVFGESNGQYVPSIEYRDNVEVKGGQIKKENSDEYVTLEVKTETITVENEQHEIVYLEGEDPNDDCHVKIVVTPYPLKETIESSESRVMIQDCYQIIHETDIPKIQNLDQTELTRYATRAGCDVDDLLVRDIFDITKYHFGKTEAEGHDPDWLHHGYVEVTLGVQSLKNFVCLLHYKGGEWEIVEHAYPKDEHTLYLDVNELSPFAIIVHEEEGTHGGGSDKDSDYDNVNTGISALFYNGNNKKPCMMHLFMLIDTIITFVFAQFIRFKEDNDEQTNKKIHKGRSVITVLSILINIVFYILGGCFFCKVALGIELITIVAIVYYTRKHKELNEE